MAISSSERVELPFTELRLKENEPCKSEYSIALALFDHSTTKVPSDARSPIVRALRILLRAVARAELKDPMENADLAVPKANFDLWQRLANTTDEELSKFKTEIMSAVSRFHIKPSNASLGHIGDEIVDSFVEEFFSYIQQCQTTKTLGSNEGIIDHMRAVSDKRFARLVPEYTFRDESETAALAHALGQMLSADTITPVLTYDPFFQTLRTIRDKREMQLLFNANRESLNLLSVEQLEDLYHRIHKLFDTFPVQNIQTMLYFLQSIETPPAEIVQEIKKTLLSRLHYDMAEIVESVGEEIVEILTKLFNFSALEPEAIDHVLFLLGDERGSVADVAHALADRLKTEWGLTEPSN